MSSTQKTCEQIIDAYMASRMQTIRPDLDDMELPAMLELASSEGVTLDPQDEDEDGDDYEERIRRELTSELRGRASDIALGISKATVYRIDLGTGGPADWIELTWSGEGQDGGWDGGRYVYADWYDSAERRLDSSDATEIAEVFGIYPAE